MRKTGGLPAFALLLAAMMLQHSATTAARPPAAGPTFDVVSIKRNTSVIGPGYRSNFATWRPDGGLTMVNVNVGNIIARAYPGTVPADIVGLPDWDRNEHFDVAATSTLARATPDDRATMLRAMLADRFKLTLHVEKRQHPVYNLVLARSDGRLGPGLKAISVDCAPIVEERTAVAEAALSAGTPPPLPRAPTDFKLPPPPCTVRTVGAMLRDRSGDGLGRLGDLMEGETTMGDLAKTLRFTTRLLVVNKTSLAGSYHITMNFDGMSAFRGPDLKATDSAAPSVFTAIQEQLGLKLESSRIELDTLVIDHLERPTEN